MSTIKGLGSEIDLSLPKRARYTDTGQELGRGHFSQVKLGLSPNDSPVADKVVRVGEAAFEEAKNLERFRGMAHVVQGRDAFLGSPKKNPEERQFHIVMEYIPHEEVDSYSLPIVCSIGRQTAEAFARIHSQGFILYDVKPENLLYLPSCNTLKLLDFGGAREIGSKIRPHFTLNYVAPEYLLGKQVTPTLDIWSLGCTLYKFFTGKLLFSFPKEMSGLDKQRNLIGWMVQMLGMPTAAYLQDCKSAELYFDENHTLIKPNVELPMPISDWREEVRRAGARKKSTPAEVDSFIELLERIFQYEDRPTAQDLLKMPILRQEYNFHLQYDKKLGGELFIYRQSKLPGLDPKRHKECTPDIHLDLSQTVCTCIHIPRDPQNIYTFIFERNGMSFSVEAHPKKEAESSKVDLIPKQLEIFEQTSKAKRKLSFEDESSSKRARKENIPPEESSNNRGESDSTVPESTHISSI
ncbi:MAG TPA: protein kinase [Candidatus Babeliaceae bacterium]|nr:protein kinase [Candidatus Babeliaceae bacterium]